MSMFKGIYVPGDKTYLVFYRLPANIFLFKIITYLCILIFVNLYCVCEKISKLNKIEQA